MRVSLGLVVVGLGLGLLCMSVLIAMSERLADRVAGVAAWGVLFACYVVCAGLGSSLLIAVFHANQWLSLGVCMLLASPIFLLARWLEPL